MSDTPAAANAWRCQRAQRTSSVLCAQRLLALALALHHLLYSSFGGTAGHARCAFSLRSGFLASSAFQPLAFCSIFYMLCIHSSTFIPAYFSIIFFSP